MSFFGFDPSLPRDRGHPTKAPGFGQVPDTFAGLSSRAAEDDDDDGIDFEDTYDGLGDQLDETDDALNDDTFGGDDGAPVAIGKDFDFHGATSRVANVIEEEHAIYARSANRKKSVQTSPPPKQTTVRETTQFPSLQPDASLWGAVPPPQARHTPAPAQYEQPQLSQAAQQTYQQPYQMNLPIGKKAMTLEEVEAEMFALNKNKQSMGAPSQQMPPAHPGHIQNIPPQLLQQPVQKQTPPPVSQLHHVPPGQPPPVDLQQLPPQHLLPHLQQMLQRNASGQSVPPQFQEPASRTTTQPPPPQSQAPLQQGRNQYGMTTHIPAQHIQSMTEAERTAYLEEESRRLKRNHKIAQLARYNGLMTPSDKNFITRIQLQQLVSINNADDNANEDFYYMVHSAIRARANPTQPLNQFAQTYLNRHGGRAGNRRQDNHLQRMEQQVARAVAAAKMRPKASQLVLEGSLGKISFSNVKTPRPMLNIKKSEGPGEQVRKPHTVLSGADRKSMLRVIENVYDALLDLEIHERDRAKLPILAPAQPPQQAHFDWQAEHDKHVLKLWTATKILDPIDPTSNITHPFIAILSYSKMKRAIPRIFRHLDAEQRLTILTMIVVHLDVLDVVKHGVYLPEETQLPSAHREEIEMFASNVLPPLLGYVYESPLSIVSGLLGILLDRVDVQAVSKTKIGLAFLTMFSSRAEIVKQSGPVADQDLRDWDRMYNRLFDSLQGHWMECFPPSGKFVDDVYVWQFLASIAVGANMAQQQALVSAVKDRVMENVMASKTLPPELGSQKSANVNLFMRAMGLDVELLG